MLLLDFMKSLHWSFHLWKEYNRDWLVEIGNAGKNCKIGPGIKISHPKKVTLGRKCDQQRDYYSFKRWSFYW